MNPNKMIHNNRHLLSLVLQEKMKKFGKKKEDSEALHQEEVRKVVESIVKKKSIY